jgi:hypothetical protein
VQCTSDFFGAVVEHRGVPRSSYVMWKVAAVVRLVCDAVIQDSVDSAARNLVRESGTLYGWWSLLLLSKAIG